MCENVCTLPQKVFKEIDKLAPYQSKTKSNTFGVDIAKLSQKNAKELKAL